MSIHIYNPDKIADSWSDDCYSKVLSQIWDPNSLTYEELGKSFNKLPENYKRSLLNVIAFFASSDGKVTESLEMRVIPLCEHKEQADLYTQQSFIETIHSRTYSRLITAMTEGRTRDLLLANTFAKRLINITSGYIDKVYNDAAVDGKPNFAKRVSVFFRFGAIELIFFTPLFLDIFLYDEIFTPADGYNFGQLRLSNEWIRQDESIHVETHVNIGRFYVPHAAQHGEEWSFEIAKAYLDELLPIAYELGEACVPDDCPYLTCHGIRRYIRLQANRYLEMWGFPAAYDDAGNDYKWVKSIGINHKVNNFERTSWLYLSASGQMDYNVPYDAMDQI